jgi:hypothetical protein
MHFQRLALYLGRNNELFVTTAVTASNAAPQVCIRTSYFIFELKCLAEPWNWTCHKKFVNRNDRYSVAKLRTKCPKNCCSAPRCDIILDRAIMLMNGWMVVLLDPDRHSWQWEIIPTTPSSRHQDLQLFQSYRNALFQTPLDAEYMCCCCSVGTTE